MQIGYFGAGTWGFCLASLLANNGHSVSIWTRNQELADTLKAGKNHPDLKSAVPHRNMSITCKLDELLTPDHEVLIESVTSGGIRDIFTRIKESGISPRPLVLTSKGIEQKSGLLPSEVAEEVLGPEWKNFFCCLSGPSHAEEVIKNLPTSVVCSSYESSIMNCVQELFSTPTFRVYPNTDLRGVEFGGAMKNIIAIACGISDGLGFGDNTKALLMTRGLHEIRKLSVVKGCNTDTLNGLSGMGDLCVTCLSKHSRNYNFGRTLSTGLSPEEAGNKIGMVVEGAYSCYSAYELGKKHKISLPITDAIYSILYENLSPKDAVKMLMEREIKDERL